MSLQPATYEIALERAQARRKPRTPLRSRSTLKTSPAHRKAPQSKHKKRLSVGKLKKKVWTEFSIHIRLKYANELGEVQCVTCCKWLRAWEFRTRGGDVLVLPGWKAAQAGHFVPGRTSSVLFDERNTHPQCGNCNVYLHGNLIAYFPFMQKTYGQEVIDELIQLKDQTHKWQAGELEGLFEKYKALNAANPLLQTENAN